MPLPRNLLVRGVVCAKEEGSSAGMDKPGQGRGLERWRLDQETKRAIGTLITLK